MSAEVTYTASVVMRGWHVRPGCSTRLWRQSVDPRVCHYPRVWLMKEFCPTDWPGMCSNASPAWSRRYWVTLTVGISPDQMPRQYSPGLYVAFPGAGSFWFTFVSVSCLNTVFNSRDYRLPTLWSLLMSALCFVLQWNTSQFFLPQLYEPTLGT